MDLDLDRREPCWRCDDKGWYWRVPDGFNPFLAGGFRTAATMYRVACSCAALRAQSEEAKPS
jgi:hypothetical protein